MFDITRTEAGEILLHGRFDAAQAEKARAVFDSLHESAVVNFEHLEYIASLGLGILLSTQKRLAQSGHGLTLVHLNDHIRDIFRFARFDAIFTIM